MKYVIALEHLQIDSRCDMMLNIAFQYGLMYQEYNNDMLFFIKEEIFNERTAYFFGDLLCHIFETTYSNTKYQYPDFKPYFEVGIYDITPLTRHFTESNGIERHYLPYSTAYFVVERQKTAQSREVRKIAVLKIFGRNLVEICRLQSW